MARPHNSRSAPAPASKKRVSRPRKEAQQVRSKQLVDTLMRATTRILVQEGYAALTTNRVADVAGVSVGSLYQYFPNKEALVQHLLTLHVDESLRVMRSEMSLLFGLPVERAVPAFVRLMIELHREDPALHRVFDEQLPRVGEFRRIEATIHEGLGLARAYLEAHRDELAPKNLELAAFVLVHTIESLTHAAVLTRPELLGTSELCDEISACIVRYLKG